MVCRHVCVQPSVAILLFTSAAHNAVDECHILHSAERTAIDVAQWLLVVSAKDRLHPHALFHTQTSHKHAPPTSKGSKDMANRLQ